MSNVQSKRTVLRSLLTLPIGVASFLATSSLARRAGAAQTEEGDATLERLVAAQHITDARQQITDVLHRYARGWDRRDEEALRACFHEDSTHQHGSFNGLSRDFVRAGLASVRNVKTMTHMITNMSIEVVGDEAVSECYFLSHHRRPRKEGSGDEDWFLKGRYLDRFAKRNGVWRIVHRRGLHDFSRTFAPADTSLDAAPPEQLSALKPDDPLYAMLADLHGSR